jgi:hypothetical protein
MTGARRSGARAAVIAAACSTSIALAACGGGGEAASAADQKKRAQEASLKFAQCMRDNGVDVPDPKPGQPGVVVGFGRDDVENPNFRQAEEKCRKHLEAARPELTEEQEAKFRDAALEFSRCMREEGIDFPDPTFDSKGGARIGPPAGGANPKLEPGFPEAAEKCSKEGPEGGPKLSVRPGPE